MTLGELKKYVNQGMTAKEIRDRYDPDWPVETVQDAIDSLDEYIVEAE